MPLHTHGGWKTTCWSPSFCGAQRLQDKPKLGHRQCYLIISLAQWRDFLGVEVGAVCAVFMGMLCPPPDKNALLLLF